MTRVYEIQRRPRDDGFSLRGSGCRFALCKTEEEAEKDARYLLRPTGGRIVFRGSGGYCIVEHVPPIPATPVPEWLQPRPRDLLLQS